MLDAPLFIRMYPAWECTECRYAGRHEAECSGRYKRCFIEYIFGASLPVTVVTRPSMVSCFTERMRKIPPLLSQSNREQTEMSGKRESAGEREEDGGVRGRNEERKGSGGQLRVVG